MRLLALDQSSRVTGYSIWDDNRLIKYDKFNATQDDMGERLLFIKNEVKDLIIDWEVDFVAFEDIQLQKTVNGQEIVNNVQTFKILAEVFGVIYELVTELNVDHTAVLSTVWKSQLSIKGKDRAEQKRNAQSWVVTNFGVRPTQDEVDAICIGAHLVSSDWKKAIPEKDYDWS